jgi:hypothetical protein
MPQAIVRTVDVIECLDDRIHATDDHPNLGVLAGETYPSILDKIEALVCTPEQKLAIDHTLTAPSASNPIVLKDDIPFPDYYPADDLGEFKNAVDTVGDLPSSGNTVSDMRPVLSLNAIYRWDGSAWVAFIKTGTIDHTQLTLQNGDANYLHISLPELSSLISQSHGHANTAVLDAIISLGSGIIISVAERARIPTSDEKDALVGTTYSPGPTVLPSSSNRYVTSVDPRLNTIKNPYITFGLYGTEASFTAADPSRADITDFELALAALATGGSVEFISALEVLPPDPHNATKLPPEAVLYDFNGGVNWQGIVWNDPKPLLIENLASGQAIFKMAPQPGGSTAFEIGAGAGLVTIRGITFQLGAINTLGALINRDFTVFEDCFFVGTGAGAKGIQITANGCNIRRCVFKGTLVKGIEVLGDDCSIESCQFDMTLVSSPALVISGNNCQITSSTITKGQIEVSAVQDTIFDKVRMADTSVFIDSGINTRWLGGIHQQHQQAYIGRTRTVGLVNSYADFRGASEAPFLAALSDPYTAEIEVLEGTYTFTSPVTIPAGKIIKTVRGGAVTIVGSHCFILDSSTKLEGIIFNITGASGITASTVSDAEIKNCRFTMNGPDVITNYAINILTASDFRVTGCQFAGTRGINLVDTIRSRITHNAFSSNIYSVVTDAATLDLYYADNTEEGSVCSLSGIRGIIRGNHFLGSLPTKLGTIDSLWIGNYPTTANNNNGIDQRTISTGDLLQPVIWTGVEKSSFLGTASLAFSETGTPTAVTLPLYIGARIDRSQGYAINLTWTAAVFSGNVKWEITTVFRERETLISDLGTPNTTTVLSSRTHFTVRQEESCSVSFTSADYGYVVGVDPTHVAIMIRRLSDDIGDTLPGVAYLTEVSITLPRD